MRMGIECHKLAETANAKEQLLVGMKSQILSLLVTSSSEEVGVFSNVSSEFNSAGHASARSMQLFDIRYFLFSLAWIHVEWSRPANPPDSGCCELCLRIFDVDRDWDALSPRFSHRPFKSHGDYSYLHIRNTTVNIFSLCIIRRICICSAFP